MRQPGGFFCVQGAEGGHLLIGQAEVKDVDVLPHAGFLGGFWDHHDVLLGQEAQGNLGGGFVVGGCDAVERFIF